MKLRVVIITSLILTLGACAIGKSPYSDAEVDQLGIKAYEDVKKNLPTSKDQQRTALVRCVADNLIAALPPEVRYQWEVNLFADDKVNAFAVPGGKIGVHEGLFKAAQTEAQLAAVMGHEISHVLQGHSKKRLTTEFYKNVGLTIATILVATSDKSSSEKNLIMATMGLGSIYGVMLPFNRSQESEADIEGQMLMKQAGYNPEAAIELWENMRRGKGENEPFEFFSTHPSSETRIKDLRRNLKELEKFPTGRRKSNC